MQVTVRKQVKSVNRRQQLCYNGYLSAKPGYADPIEKNAVSTYALFIAI
jgi:hypothetical protein